MRKFRVHIDTPYEGITPTVDFEIPDEATEEEVEQEAREEFLNIFNYGYEELKDGESNDQ